MVNEYSCVCLHGDRRPQERKANLQSFKDGEVRFLICTDVAARGIDARGIPFGMLCIYSVCVCVCVCVCVYIYVYVYVCICVCLCTGGWMCI